jgi:hypothetical protein
MYFQPAPSQEAFIQEQNFTLDAKRSCPAKTRGGSMEKEKDMEKEKVGGWEEMFAWVFPPLPRYPEQCRFCRIRNSNVSWD